MNTGGDCNEVSQDGTEAEEVRGEKSKNTPHFDTPVRNDEARDESSLGPMSMSSSGSMPPLESFSGSPSFSLQDPVISRLVAEAYRLGQENLATGEHSLRPANAFLRSLASSVGNAGGGMGGASANPASFTTPTPPASTSTPLSAGGSGSSTTPPSTSPVGTPASGVAGDTISTASKLPID